MDNKSKTTLKIETALSLSCIIICFIISGYYVHRYWGTVSDPEQVQQIIGSFGIWAPAVLMSAEAFQVIFPYLPGQILSVVGGYIYGVWLGTVFNLIGVCSGSLIAFSLARRYGRPIVERMIGKSGLDKFDGFFHRHGLIIIFLSRTQFFFPNDIISYGSGLTKNLSWKRYLAATFLGYIPHFLLLASVGKGLQTGFFSMRMVFYTALISSTAIVYFLREPIYRSVSKLGTVIKKNLHKVFSGK